MKTRITELFGIQHPIIQGGMHYVGFAELAAAVSNAGGLGIITGLTQAPPALLATEIAKCRDLTDKPFGVNLTFLPVVNNPDYPGYVDAILNGGVKVVETAGNNPQQWLPMLQEAGVPPLPPDDKVRIEREIVEGRGNMTPDGARRLLAVALAHPQVKMVVSALGSPPPDVIEQLKARNIVGVSGVDTRALTALIREKGMPNAVIAHEPSGVFDVEALKKQAAGLPSMDGLDLVPMVTSAQRFGWDETSWALGAGYGRLP